MLNVECGAPFNIEHSTFNIHVPPAVFQIRLLSTGAGLPGPAAEPVDQRSDVDDENDLPSADFGRAGNAGHRLQLRADRFDDDLLLADETVDEQADGLLPRPRDDDEPFRVRPLVAPTIEIE